MAKIREKTEVVLPLCTMISLLVVVFFILVFANENQAIAQTASTVITDSTSNSKVETDASSRTIVVSPPPSAISPSVGSSSSDLCLSGVSGAVQTQILGISSGRHYMIWE